MFYSRALQVFRFSLRAEIFISLFRKPFKSCKCNSREISKTRNMLARLVHIAKISMIYLLYLAVKLKLTET